MDIVSKFTVASERGIDHQFFLKRAKYKGMYENIVPADQLAQYIHQQLDYRKAIAELNALSNQMIILYVENEPAGCAIIKQTPDNPEVLRSKRVLNYSFFYIIPEYDSDEARTSLWQKCLSASAMLDAVWIEVLQCDPFVSFFEQCGFVIHEKSAMAPFRQPSYVMIRYRNEG